ncbi:MAG: hypothetical protein AAFV25_18920 [Bacteroidota bacterium]
MEDGDSLVIYDIGMLCDKALTDRYEEPANRLECKYQGSDTLNCRYYSYDYGGNQGPTPPDSELCKIQFVR